MFSSPIPSPEHPRRVDSLIDFTDMVAILRGWGFPYGRAPDMPPQPDVGYAREHVEMIDAGPERDGDGAASSCQSSSLSSASSDSSRRSSYSDRCPARLSPFTPPDNYAAVSPGEIYRCSYPKEENFEFLRTLKLKSILTLVKDDCSENYAKFMHDNGIKHYRVHVPANKEMVKITPEVMVDALKVVLDRSNYPLLIHCNKGKHRTGCVVACFKKVLGEPMRAIKEDYHIYAGAKARSLDEEFVESFDAHAVAWFARLQGWLLDDEPRSPAPQPQHLHSQVKDS